MSVSRRRRCDVAQRAEWQHHQEDRPREQAANHDRYVVPDLAWAVEARCCETFEVIRDKEALKVGGPVRHRHREIPGQSGDGKYHDGYDEVRGAKCNGATLTPPDGSQDDRWNDQRERPFRQKSKSGGKTSERPPSCRHCLFGIGATERRPDGCGDEEGERKIGERRPRHREVAVTGGCDRTGTPCGVIASGQPPRRAPGEENETQPGQRGSEARHEFGGIARRECCSRHPVVEDWLLPAILVVVVRCQPVASLDHLPRGFGVERLIRVGNGLAAESEEKGER